MITINGTAKTISTVDRAPQTRIVEAVLRSSATNQWTSIA